MNWRIEQDRVLDLTADRALMEGAFKAHQEETLRLPRADTGPQAQLPDSTPEVVDDEEQPY